MRRQERPAVFSGADDRFLSSALVSELAGHKKRRPAPLAAALCMSALALAAPAQQGNNAPVRDAPQTVIRTETRLVLVDAIVRDKKGKIVTDLGANDFRLWEDGKEQPITSASLEAAGSQDQSDAQHIVFLFDDVGFQDKDLAIRQDVAKFAGAYAGPNRYMAVADFGGKQTRIAQNLTATVERVQRAAVNETGPGDHVEAKDVISQVLAPADRYLRADVEMQQAQQPLPVQLQYQRPRPLVDAIAALADGMAAIRGRKLLIVVGASRPSTAPDPPDEQVRAVARGCNGANVAVYATSGALKTLAEETGGWRISNKLIDELGAIVDDQAKRYVLGFTPVESPDGSCHSLRVKTKRDGLDVQARNAYCNDKAPDMLAGLVKGKDLEARAAGPSAVNAAASMELPYFYSSPGIALIDLATEMDLANLKFAKVNGIQHAELDLVGLAYGTDGEVAGRFSDTVQFDFATSQEAEAFRKQPYRYERQFRLPAGRYNVRLAFSSGEQSFGKVEAPLAIDPWDGQGLALSGIGLASGSQRAPELTSDLDPSLLEGHKRLVAASAEILPSGGNRFSHSAPCFAYLEIYDSLLAGANPPTFGVAVRVFDRGTGDQKAAKAVNAASFITPGNPVIPVILDVPIASLSKGAYRLEVKAVRSPGDASVVRTVEFEVEE